MTVLAVNSGSSSLRLAAFVEDGESLARLGTRHFRNEKCDLVQVLRKFLRDHEIADVSVVAHRVVHGGERLTAPVRIDGAIESEIERVARLAPLHNPRALEWMRACRGVFGAKIPQVAVFDTAFYSTLPEVAATYALPRALCARHGIRRFGFHGLAHEALWRRWCEIRPPARRGDGAISLQLGAGCSITAVRDGLPVDTSMGFSPLEGLVMATRPGDLDSGALIHLARAEGLSLERIEQLLNEEAGLLGLSGMSGDMQILLESEEPASRLAVELYCYRARKYIGAYLAALEGAEAILFGGGVGEHAPLVRAKILSRLARLGIVLDPVANRTAVGREMRISHRSSEVEVWVIPVDEAVVLAQSALAVMASSKVGGFQERR